VILERPVEEWPLCDVMLSWHSEGFPLWKAQQYVKLRRPFLINDVYMQVWSSTIVAVQLPLFVKAPTGCKVDGSVASCPSCICLALLMRQLVALL
jgi:hypothetical protein